jgi:hypothetical protein
VSTRSFGFMSCAARCVLRALQVRSPQPLPSRVMMLHRGWCCDRCAVSPPLPPPRVHRSLHPHVSLVASIEPGSRVGALRLMCVCVRQVWLWSYRGDEGATTSRGALRTLYGWRSWMHPAVTCSVSGLLYVVTLRSEVTARIETHDIARRCGCARAR